MKRIVPKIFFTFIVFISRSNCKKQSYLAESLLYFSKKLSKTNLKNLNKKFWLQWEQGLISYLVWKILAHFCNLIALIFSWNCLKGVRVTDIVIEYKFQEVWRKLETKICFERQLFTKYLILALAFMWNDALREKKYSFSFSRHF